MAKRWILVSPDKIVNLGEGNVIRAEWVADEDRVRVFGPDAIDHGRTLYLHTVDGPLHYHDEEAVLLWDALISLCIEPEKLDR